jgi:hypothetical protein
MKTNRRDFINFAGAAGTGMMAVGMTACNNNEPKPYAGTLAAVMKTHTQRFNMSGCAAPKLATVRIGIVGPGKRGMGAVHRLKPIEGLARKTRTQSRIA